MSFDQKNIRLYFKKSKYVQFYAHFLPTNCKTPQTVLLPVWQQHTSVPLLTQYRLDLYSKMLANVCSMSPGLQFRVDSGLFLWTELPGRRMRLLFLHHLFLRLFFFLIHQLFLFGIHDFQEVQKLGRSGPAVTAQHACRGDRGQTCCCYGY